MNKTAEDLYLAGQIMAEGFMDKLAEELEKEAKEEKQKRTLKGVLFGATPRGKALRGLAAGLGAGIGVGLGSGFGIGRLLGGLDAYKTSTESLDYNFKRLISVINHEKKLKALEDLLK